MSAFQYKDGILHAEDVALPVLADTVGTPAYIYSSAALVRNYQAFAMALHAPGAPPIGICYALKANSNQAVIRTLARLGAGADVVSGGELARALAARVPPDRIVFSGVGKTADEMRAALDAGIHQINVESEPELELLSAVAASSGREAAVAIRVNPDVDAGTHAKISTGKKENKFGIDIGQARAVFAKAARLPGIQPLSVAVHIGSQLTGLGPFAAAFDRVAELVAALRADGHAIERLDLGGGLGVAYRGEQPPDLAAYARLVRATAERTGCRTMIEPGRALVADAGVLLARVLYVKEGESRRFLILDAAMNDLIRPSLYEAWHTILPVKEPVPGAPLMAVDIVGPICESGDTFAQQRPMPPIETGELVAIMTAGAYGAVMASTYNTRPLAPEVLVDGAGAAVVRPRQTVEELIAAERMAPWLG